VLKGGYGKLGKELYLLKSFLTEKLSAGLTCPRCGKYREDLLSSSKPNEFWTALSNSLSENFQISSLNEFWEAAKGRCLWYDGLKLLHLSIIFAVACVYS